MFAFLKPVKTQKKSAQNLYDTCKKQSRIPVFYEDKGVPDTLDGRFELLLLHGFLVWNVLRAEEATSESERLAQRFFDVMFRDIHHALRNMGIGDLAVPRHMKLMMKSYQGRAVNYKNALEAGDKKTLQDALKRNLFGTVSKIDEKNISFFISYIKDSVKLLDKQNVEDILSGKIKFLSVD